MLGKILEMAVKMHNHNFPEEIILLVFYLSTTSISLPLSLYCTWVRFNKILSTEIHPQVLVLKWIIPGILVIFDISSNVYDPSFLTYENITRQAQFEMNLRGCYACCPKIWENPLILCTGSSQESIVYIPKHLHTTLQRYFSLKP